MTLPTITYGCPWQSDCDSTSGWSKVVDGAVTTISVVAGTVFDFNVTSVGGNKQVYYEYDFTNVSPTIYKKVIGRYKTSNTNIKALVMVIFTSGNQTVLAASSSTDWTVFTSDDLYTNAGNIDKIRLYAKEATGHVYYDFVTFAKGTFTFPDFSLISTVLKPKLALVSIPERDTDVIQHLGRANTEITISGIMRSGATWGGSNLTYGEYLYDIARNRAFQWLTTDQGNWKVVPDPTGFIFSQDESSGEQLLFNLKFLEYEAGDTSNSLFDDPAWYGR